MELTKSEMEIMDVLWNAGSPLSRADLLDRGEEKTWKDSSVHILLNGLLQFGMFQPASAFREPWTFITSMFLHEPRSIFHILFNMLTLWAVGPFLERLMGHWAYLVLYAVSGIGGGMGMM